MKRSKAREILQIPNKPFVDFCVSLANLTPDELESVSLREWNGLTIEEAAYAAAMSETRHKRLYLRGMNKLQSCWECEPWIESVLEKYKDSI